jgi:hypothetical protein
MRLMVDIKLVSWLLDFGMLIMYFSPSLSD